MFQSETLFVIMIYLLKHIIIYHIGSVNDCKLFETYCKNIQLPTMLINTYINMYI